MRSILVSLALILTACGNLETVTGPDDVGSDPIDQTATFTRVQNEVFTPTCSVIGCHNPIGQQSQMVLTAGRAYGDIVGRPSVEMPSINRVTAFDAPNSYLYRKITGAGITGDRMPQGQPPLTEAQIRLIRDWIRRGAPND
jgi:hypothetical protein